MRNHLYNVTVNWTMAVTLKIAAPSEDDAKDKAFQMNEGTEGTLPGGEYCHNSFEVGMIELSEMQPSEWVEITKHPSLPCSLNSFINESNKIEYIVEIDGNTNYHDDLLVAMEGYIRSVVRLEEKREE